MELAQKTGTDAGTLHRFLRTLANFDIVTIDANACFALTDLGQALRSDGTGSVHSAILTLGGPMTWHAWEQRPYAIETGKPAFDKAFGMPIFDYLAEHPKAAARFSETMVAVHGAEPAAVAEAYDFSFADIVVDVGGASGNMLASVLGRYETPGGVLFDLPQAMTEAPATLERRGVANRVSIEAGSFFERLPEGGDVYILSHIIHDWNEERALTILENCRKAMNPKSRLLLIELVLREGGAPGYGSADSAMLVLCGAAERTATEYEQLRARAGLRLTRVISTSTSASIVEAVVT